MAFIRSFADVYPELSPEWSEKNEGLTPEDINVWSRVLVWMRCPQSIHDDYQISPFNRGRTTWGCKPCSYEYRSIPAKGASFAEVNPKILSYINDTHGVDLSKIKSQSLHMVSCTCDSGHQWEVRLSSLTAGRWCPWCSGLYVSHDDSLGARFPEIGAEWHTTKNHHTVFEVLPDSDRRTDWWKCSGCGHEWQARVYARTMNGQGCPSCQTRWGSSQEEAILMGLIQVMTGLTVERNIRIAPRLQVDAYLPDLSIALEYDGSYWHSLPGASEKDEIKSLKIKNLGHRIIRVREHPLNKVGSVECVTGESYLSDMATLAARLIFGTENGYELTAGMWDEAVTISRTSGRELRSVETVMEKVIN